ncbi:aminoacyl-tRNA hydrolase [Candidatus Aerophobetes bacterium]|uniref:Peptidyl-tRNA hydrolase n=1 Tax=Aerophobetes bacterium TaxID=2030807 RepID=A0A2A4YKD0_UNCAE|nr:MAG: aminoacyl-tRNA hydrolase [Candidatus Aerophobetes bacterium]
MSAEAYLIVGLGNPGKKYEMTRHNMGFLVVEKLAERLGATLSPNKAFMGRFGKASIEGKKVYFLLPSTFMNLSGQAVRRCIDYYNLTKERLLIVSDDVALPFGKLRIREKGSAGGHNGLKDVERHLGTQEYQRLRVGVGSNGDEDLDEYVVGNFNSHEKKLLPEIQIDAALALEEWVKVGFEEVLKYLAPKSLPKKETEIEKQIKE